MKTKNILITGCSSGIGKDVAITLHNKGWRVFATCRSKTDCTFFTKLGIESFPLDLLKEESINCAVNLVKEKTKSQLDVLFNNGIKNPKDIELSLNNIPGVLENGLFVDLTDKVLVGKIENSVPIVYSPSKIC